MGVFGEFMGAALGNIFGSAPKDKFGNEITSEDGWTQNKNGEWIKVNNDGTMDRDEYQKYDRDGNPGKKGSKMEDEDYEEWDGYRGI